MPKFINQIYQLTRSEGGPVLNMTRAMPRVGRTLDRSTVLPPGGTHVLPLGDIRPLLFAVQTSARVDVVLVSGGDIIPIHTFAVLNAPPEKPFSWLELINPEPDESVDVQYMIAGVTA